MNIDYRIQELRKQKGISQSHLADKINVSRQAVSKQESGQSIPDIDKIVSNESVSLKVMLLNTIICAFMPFQY